MVELLSALVSWSLVLFYGAGIILAVYVIHDVLVDQEMVPMEQLLWIIGVLLLNLVGAAVYLAVVRYGEGPVLEPGQRDSEEPDRHDASPSTVEIEIDDPGPGAVPAEHAAIRKDGDQDEGDTEDDGDGPDTG